MRERYVRWENPLASAAQSRTQSGRDVLEAIIAGTIPAPPIGTVHGGLVRRPAEA